MASALRGLERGAWLPWRHEGVEQGALRQHRIGPQAAGMQRGRGFAAFAGAFAMQQRHRDRREQVQARHLIALRRQREGG
ncbi:MAG TPA: hypothetical protein VK634_01410, partial [Reyranella sp.]|nr:hypothetical protein [Reyranella sp.]